MKIMSSMEMKQLRSTILCVWGGCENGGGGQAVCVFKAEHLDRGTLGNRNLR